MELENSIQQHIHFVTGKGGVGKSMLSLGMAQKFAESGKKTLLVELGEHSFFEDLLSLEGVHFQPIKAAENLEITLWSGAECLREYARHLIKIESLAKLFFENPVMKTFINVAPALPELAIMGKLTSTYRNHGPKLPYEIIVVDCYSTGHFLSLMRAAAGMAEVIKMGPMGEQSRTINAAIRNSELCSYHIVTLAEELPVEESRELMATLISEFKIQPQLIFNKILNSPLSSTELAKVDEADNMYIFANYLKYQLERQKASIDSFATHGVDIKKVSLHFQEDPWLVAKAIARELQ